MGLQDEQANEPGSEWVGGQAVVNECRENGLSGWVDRWSKGTSRPCIHSTVASEKHHGVQRPHYSDASFSEE